MFRDSVPGITAGFYSIVWDKLVPQLGQTEPAVYHTMLAVASLYEETQLSGAPLDDSTSPLPGSFVSSAQSYALHQYTTALRELQIYMTSPHPAPTVILATCLLFVCIESLRGRWNAASRHIESGLAILKNVITHNRSTSTQALPAEEIVPKNLSSGFGRLSLLFTSIERPDEQDVIKKLQIDPAIFSDAPEKLQFTTLVEARGALSPLLSKAAQLVFPSATALERRMAAGPDPSVTARIELDAQLRRWGTGFDRLLREGSAPIVAGHEVLRGFAKMTSIRIWASLYPDDASLDFLNADFEEFLECAERCMVLQGWTTDGVREKRGSSVFVMDLGIIGPLLFAAVRCADPKLRMRAIEMLERAPRREALWCSVTAARQARQANLAMMGDKGFLRLHG